MSLLQRAGLLDEDRTRLLLSWRHSGFSVHNTVTVPVGDGRALEALARYCLQSPLSLARLRWTPGSETATYLPRAGHDKDEAEVLDALDCKQSRSPRGRTFILRRRLPRRPPLWPPYAVDGLSSFAGCTKSIRSSVPAAGA